MTETYDNGRIGLWMATAELISKRPLFGYGEGQTQHYVPIPWTAHPHDIFLQILLAWGVVGLILCLGLAYWAVMRARNRINRSTLTLAVGILVLLFYSLIDGALYNVHTTALFAAMMGLLLAAPVVTGESFDG